MTAPAKHTPGPWHRAGESRIVAETGPTVAEARRFLPLDAADANARLIAAAPDLLAACDDALSDALMGASVAREESVRADWRLKAERYRAAIARAREVTP